MSVRLKPGLSDAERSRAVALVRDAVRMPEWRLQGGAGYVVTGVPVLAGDLTGELAGSTLRLLLVAVAVMALVLALLFRARLRLLPLAIALGACAIVFGGLALLGLPLTMASIAVLPVLLGLAVDYAIQYQARGPDALPPCRRSRPRRWRRPSASSSCCASPVPMVRGFGALLIAGVAVALVLAFTAGTAVLTLAARRRASDGALARSLRGAGELVDGARGGASRVLAPARLSGAARCGSPCGIPGRLLAVAGAAAAIGWALDSRISVESELPRLVPQSLGAVRDLEALQRETGVAGEVDVLVEGRDLTDPAVIAWMRDYQYEVLAAPRLLGRARLPRRGAVPGAVAAGPVPHAGAVRDARAGARAARRRAAVLLAGRDHARPADGGARLRAAAAVAGGPACGDRGHARAARSAGRACARRSPGCRCSRPTRTTR